MGKPTGFIEYNREQPPSRNPRERIKDFKEVYLDMGEEKTREQAARCMDCGIPFCHNGCPLGNNIPEFNDAVYRENWEYAAQVLLATNNFPEFTGRICPAPCEASCVLGLHNAPVSIEHIEKQIAEKAFELGYIQPQPPKVARSGKKVAIIGSGPTGMAAADQLNQAGHTVTVFERDEAPGGLLRFGIPDFKLEKWVIDRRINLMEQEGIHFRCGVNVGEDLSMEEMLARYDAVLLCCGSLEARDMHIPGRELSGVHLAMDYLCEQNRQIAAEGEELSITAEGKRVVVIGGGDTGADCIGTANRQGALSVAQLAYRDRPPLQREPDNPWPHWPMILQTSSSHEEGCDRLWALVVKEFLGDENQRLRAIRTVRVEWEAPAPGQKAQMVEIPGSEEDHPCELALLAVGFLHPERKGPIAQLGLQLDSRGNVACQDFQTSHPKVFAAGDMRRGQSLVVWAIHEGREAARKVDQCLMGTSDLPSKTASPLQA
jgi:glutamate synthase (NADPH/NADH) small chain